MRIERHHAVPSADRAALLDFWVRAWTPVIPTIDFAARRDWFSGHLDTLLRDGASLLLTRGIEGTAVGLVTLHPGTGLIEQIAVDPRVSGQGIARAMIGEAKRLSPAGLTLTVNQVNARALALYRQAGFVVTGEATSARSRLPVWAMAWTPAAL